MADQEHKQILDLLPAYAIGALDDDEAVIVKGHLADCSSCQAEFDAYESVVTMLPLAAPRTDPPTVLKERLMDRTRPRFAGEKAVIDGVRPRSSEVSWWEQAAAAVESFLRGPIWRPALVLLVIVLLVGNVLQWQQANQPDPNSWRRIRLAGTESAPDASGIIYISADGLNGTLIVDKLPQLGPDQQYQLWLIEDGERTSGGIFSVDKDGYRGIEIESSEPLQEYGSFGITIEPAGGSPGPTGQRVLGYNL